MIFYFLSFIMRTLLSLRYRIRIHGLDEILKKGRTGILFLPNHPALIDPPIVTSILFGRFNPYVIVLENEVKGTPLEPFIKQLHFLTIPEINAVGRAGIEATKKQFEEAISLLHDGKNVLMYPSGRVYRCRYENIRANTGAYTLISQAQDIRIVMIRTSGLWGSSFSRSGGSERPFFERLLHNGTYILRNLIFFMPRRTVNVTFQEAGPEFPRTGNKDQINRYLESYYNADAPGNTYVPYRFWEAGGTRVIPEPAAENLHVNTSHISEQIKEKVYAKLRDMTSVNEIHDQSQLGLDLGMDSLMLVEVVAWIQNEFGFFVNNPESLKTVAHVLLAATGENNNDIHLQPVPDHWFITSNQPLPDIPEGDEKITDVFLKLAAKKPNSPLLADQLFGVVTNRQAVLYILVAKDILKKLPGDRIGIIMPSCIPFFVMFMAALYAGKTPVLLNWTVGSRNLAACVRKSGIQCILSAKRIIEQLERKGTDFSGIKDKLLYFDDLKEKITLFHKLFAVFEAYFCWHSLYTANVPETVAILFTSGSESEPKAVPLVHRNSMSDLKYAARAMNLTQDACVLGMLPPFHSFGLLIDIMIPALLNARVVYHMNPTEGAYLAHLIGAYKPTLIIATPTFVSGILTNAVPNQVDSIEIIITGAEKCPQKTIELCHQKCPKAQFLEGYGITECGPIVSLNLPGASKPGTIGRVLECTDWMICNDKEEVLPAHQTGMLYVSGPAIFHGYFAYEGASPFIERNGKTWYRTGDLVQADEEGYITFMGRLKRFIKVAGEMVSLPAIEQLLLSCYKNPDGAVPLAVEAQGPDNDPQIILFTTIDLDRNEVNQKIRESGFSPIHYIKEVVKLDEIPLLGSGKTDYRKLKSISVTNESK